MFLLHVGGEGGDDAGGSLGLVSRSVGRLVPIVVVLRYFESIDTVSGPRASDIFFVRAVAAAAVS